MYLEKSLNCLSKSNWEGDESDEIKKRLAREEVSQVEAGKKGLEDKKIIFIFIQDKDKEEGQVEAGIKSFEKNTWLKDRTWKGQVFLQKDRFDQLSLPGVKKLITSNHREKDRPVERKI